jgi:hypothetical protein
MTDAAPGRPDGAGAEDFDTAVLVAFDAFKRCGRCNVAGPWSACPHWRDLADVLRAAGAAAAREEAERAEARVARLEALLDHAWTILSVVCADEPPADSAAWRTEATDTCRAIADVLYGRDPLCSEAGT